MHDPAVIPSTLPSTPPSTPDAPARAAALPSEAALARVQAISGLTFGTFLVVHVANALVATLGPAAHDEVQGALRAVYQAPPVELVVVGLALVVHVGAGVMRARRRRRATAGAETRLHRRLGWALALIVIGHATATRGVSLVYGVWPGFAGVSLTLHEWGAFFYPYYLFFGVAAALHGGVGAARALRLLTRRRLAAPAWAGKAALGVFAAALLVALLAFGGALFAVPDPRASDYARVVIGR